MGKEEEKKAQELAKQAEDMEAKEKYLDELQVFLKEKEGEIKEREKALESQGPSVSLAEPAEKPLTKNEQKLIDDGCKAYGIDKEYLFNGKGKGRVEYVDGVPLAVLVTIGGAKVRFRKSDKVEQLDQVRVDGISRKKPRYVAGKKK